MIEIMINNEVDKVIEKPFKSLIIWYQTKLELMKGSEFVFDYVPLLYYKCHKTNSNCGASYTDSPDWIKNKRATLNPINKMLKKKTNASNTL